MLAWFGLSIGLSLCLVTARPVHADEPAAAPPAPADAPADDPKIVEARKAFDEGSDFVSKSEWAKALASFERSMELRPHPVTQYDIAIAERALGQYTRSRASFHAALESTGAERLPAPLVQQATTFETEVDAVLSELTLDVEPSGAAIAVDGRPLEPIPAAGVKGTVPRFVAGTLPPGKGNVIEARKITLSLDPGAHVIVFRRKGFSEVALNRSMSPGAKETQKVALDRLPATIRVTSNETKARVTIDGADVGLTPVDVPRPPGSYAVEVSKKGRVPFTTRVTLEPGGEANLRAPLPARKQTLAEKWWFWTAASVVVTGVAVGTYFAVRPAAERPAVDGGTLGWAVDLR